MATKARVTLENAYWVGDDIYTKVDGKPYLVDSGAEVSMTRRSLETKGHLKVQLANGTLEEMPFGIWKRIVWLKGPYDLITTRDLKELQLPKRLRRSLRRRLDKLQARVVRLEPAQSKATPTNWYKPVNVTETTEQKIQESDFSPKGKETLKQIIAQANVARFKNDCGDLGGKYVHTIEGGVHPPVRQYPLNPGAVEEMDKIVRELSALGIIREEPSPITNSPIQAVKKPESAGGGWRPVINFKALNRRTIANRASLINPQGALKTLQVKKYKSCIDLANGFFSLRLAKQSQGKTAFTHKEKAYVWQRLPQGYKNSPNVFQSAVMDVLKDLGATIYIDDVFIADDTEEEHLEKLQKVVKRLTEAGLKLNLKKCQFGQFEVTYLGFQVAADLGLSEGYKEKLEQLTPLKTIYRRFWDSAITLETMYHTTKNMQDLSLKEDLSIWEENGFEGEKGKAVAHQDLWKKIAELRLTMNLDVVHQKAHGKESAHWRGNDEVDRYVQQRRIVFVGIEKWDKTHKGKVVPKESVEEVVQAVHESLGHAGTMPTRKELEKQQLWVPGDQVRPHSQRL
ncbi:hypothetical protein L3Q82_017294 [Scortum barcoo]|uniref:Uncharacterized protein n=1 Tax=Scortum barcoo TaxID=214431 RepID=A0ACB8VK09_9TELE|nr:hypothetical protein L3Q82_017294 [Scortum barcoo]